jgi:peroxiredoxin
MIELGLYSGNNVTLFKSFDIDMGKKGFTHIIGKNLNSDMDKRNNGSGKTLLFYGMQDILTGSNHKILNKGDLKGSISLEIDDKTFSIMGNKREYFIPTDSDTPDKVVKKVFDETIAEVFPISQAIFDSTIFLNNTYNPFRQGTSIARTNWISDIFDFHKYDEMLVVIKERLKELRSILKYGESVNEEWIRLASVEKVEVEDFSEDITKLEKFINTYSNGYSEEERQNAIDLLEKHNIPFDSNIDDLKKESRKAIEQYSKWFLYDKYLKDLDNYNKVHTLIMQMGGIDLVMQASKVKGKPAKDERIKKILKTQDVKKVNNYVRGLNKLIEASPLLSELELFDDLEVMELKDKYEKILRILENYADTELDRSTCIELIRKYKEPKEVEKAEKPSIHPDEYLEIFSALRVVQGKQSKDLTKHYKKLKNLRTKQKTNGDLNAKYIVSRKRMKAIKEQVIEYRSALKGIELYKILEKAYSNKGIKLMLLKDICQLLEDNMNAYSNLVYPEKTTFTISSDKDITVTYTTGTNINTEVSNSIFLVAPSNYEITNEMAREEIKNKLSVSWLKNNGVN